MEQIARSGQSRVPVVPPLYLTSLCDYASLIFFQTRHPGQMLAWSCPRNIKSSWHGLTFSIIIACSILSSFFIMDHQIQISKYTV